MKQTFHGLTAKRITASHGMAARSSGEWSSAPGTVGRGAALVPNPLRGRPKALRGLWAHPRELGFGLLRTPRMDCPALHPPPRPPPAPAGLAMTVLLRPDATAPQVKKAPFILDDMIAFFAVQVHRSSANLTHTPIHPGRTEMSPVVPQESWILPGHHVRAWSSIERIHGELRTRCGRVLYIILKPTLGRRADQLQRRPEGWRRRRAPGFWAG